MTCVDATIADTGGNSTVNVGGGTGTSALVVSEDLVVGNYGNGTLNITGGGAVTSKYGQIPLAGGDSGIGTVTVGGGVGTSTWTLQGSPSQPALQMTDGTLTITGGGSVSTSRDAIIGRYTGGVSTVTVGGGSGTSTLTVATQLFVGRNVDATEMGTGILNINAGGTVIAGFLDGGNATSSVNLNGGTLRITNTDSASNRMFINGAGGTIDVPTAANTFSISSSISRTSGAGGLTRTGAGTLALSAGNDYTGGTTVSAGRLLVSNSTGSATGFGSVTVNNGATLAGGDAAAAQGFIAPNSGSTVTVNGTLAPGNGPSVIGVLTIGKASSPTALSIPGRYSFNIATTSAGSASAINNGSSSAARTNTTGNNLLAILGTSASTVDFTGVTIQLNATSANLGGNWDSAEYFSWVLVTLPDGVTPTLSTTTFDTAGFAPPTNGGAFSLSFSDVNNSLYMNFTPAPAPEPSFVLLSCTAGLAGWVIRHKMRK